MLRRLSAISFVLAAATLSGATLERLSVDDMIRQSTMIVRGTVGASTTENRKSILYTHYSIRVTQRWKGSVSATVDVAIPGGAANGLRQTFSGAPILQPGSEYLFFLWTSKSGLTQIIGLSQGLFTLKRLDSGEIVLTRPATSELMLDPMTGSPVPDSSLSLKLKDLSVRIQALSDSGAQE